MLSLVIFITHNIFCWCLKKNEISTKFFLDQFLEEEKVKFNHLYCLLHSMMDGLDMCLWKVFSLIVFRNELVACTKPVLIHHLYGTMSNKSVRRKNRLFLSKKFVDPQIISCSWWTSTCRTGTWYFNWTLD